MQASVVEQQHQDAGEPPRVDAQRERIHAGDLDLRVVGADPAHQPGQVDRLRRHPLAATLQPREFDEVAFDPPSTGGAAHRRSVVPGLVGRAQCHRALRLRCDRG